MNGFSGILFMRQVPPPPLILFLGHRDYVPVVCFSHGFCVRVIVDSRAFKVDGFDSSLTDSLTAVVSGDT